MEKAEFNRRVSAIRLYFGNGFRLEELRQEFLYYTQGRENRLRTYTANNVDQLVEAGIDFSDLHPDDIMDIIAMVMRRFNKGKAFPDIWLFVEQFFSEND